MVDNDPTSEIPQALVRVTASSLPAPRSCRSNGAPPDERRGGTPGRAARRSATFKGCRWNADWMGSIYWHYVLADHNFRLPPSSS
jgi:hypothetical protein